MTPFSLPGCAQLDARQPTAVTIEVVHFDLNDSSHDQFLSGLSADERARASRYKFDRDRIRYTRGRGVLRDILAKRVGIAADEIALGYGPKDKPFLANGHLHFNVAHSENVAVVAISHRELGIDVELLREGFADDTIAERFFAPTEVQQLRALPVSDQEPAFFRCWTRKEAYLKAIGDGLSIPLDDFTVEFASTRQPSITWIRNRPDEPQRWTVIDCSEQLNCNATAAIAIRDSIPTVQFSRR